MRHVLLGMEGPIVPILEMVIEVGAAGGALRYIPVPGVVALRAAPPRFLLPDPGIDADLLLAADVVQHLAVVSELVVVEVGDKPAGEIGAPGAPVDPLRGSAVPDVAVAAGGGPDLGQAAVTIHIFDPYRVAEVSGQPIGDEFDELGVVFLDCRTDDARPALVMRF